MRINGFSGTNTQTGTMGMTQGNDSVSKNIQNQIANAQSATAAQMSTLAAGAAAEETDSVKNTDIKGETQVTVETPTLENAQNATQQAVYTPIDIRV